MEGLTNIPNASHWLNNSVVIVKEDYTGGDEAYILNQLVRIDSASVQVTDKHKDVLTVQRMVQPGSVVAVNRPSGRVKTVHLPEEASELLWSDTQYIVEQINKLNEPPMTEDEKKGSSASAKEHSQANLTRVK